MTDQQVIDELAEVRESGACNMLDVPCVYDYAQAHELYELSMFIEEKDNDVYMHALTEMGRQRA